MKSFFLAHFVQAAIDLDQKVLEEALAEVHFTNARAFYTEGGHSKSYAEVTLSKALTQDIPQGTAVTGKTRDGNDTGGTLLEKANSGSKKLKIRYSISPIQEKYVRCQVGALPRISGAHLEGCK